MRKASKNILIELAEEYRIYIIFVLIFVFMSLFAPKFFNIFNITNIIKGMCLNATVAIGFTIVMISGQLDLSIGTAVTLGSILVIGLQPRLGWTLSLIIALIAGCAAGLFNGLLVAKAKIHSFIVTLGTMYILQGLIYIYSKGYTLDIKDFSLADWMEKALIPFVTPRVLITIILLVLFEIFIKKVAYGRGFFLIGGNKETAWLAGLNTDRYLIIAFILSGFTASLGGALFAMGMASSTADVGNPSLMMVIAATIIGGTSMAGGKGSIIKSAIAVLMLTSLHSGLNCFGAGFEIRTFIDGLILSVIVFYEAYTIYKHDKVKGQRHELLEEIKNSKGV